MFFKIVKHTADLQLEVSGKSLADLFANVLIAMFQSIKPETKNCLYDQDGLLVCPILPKRHDVVVHAPTIEQLLVDFLSEALYLSDIHNEAYLAVTIKYIDATNIKATLLGVCVEGFENEIKAVTYHLLKIEQKKEQWCATIVFDI